MKIGLINPNKQIKEPAVHLGLGYIASYARQQRSDLKFELLDTRIATQKEENAFFDSQFDVIGITASAQTFSEALEHTLKIGAQHPDTIIVLGGSYVSTLKAEILEKHPFHYAIFGEGEEAFVGLIECIEGKRAFQDVDGLIYRDGNKVVENSRRRVIPELDSIPFPAYDLFKMDRYGQHRMITSRGCPYQCVFCNSHSIWTNKWRKRTAKNILDEIDLLAKSFDMKSFIFNDDSFNIDLKRVEEVCDALIEKKTGIIWTTSIRVDRITKTVAEKLKEAGCYVVNIGIESANNDVLKRIKKSNTKEKIYEGIQTLRAAGLEVMGQFMIGNPGDTLETIKESIEFAKNSNLTTAEFYTALPYQDSPLWDFVRLHGKMLTDRPSYEYHLVNPRIVFETKEFTFQERIEAVELARKNGFYHALSTDKPMPILDLGRRIAKESQRLLGGKAGNKLYLGMRNIYRKFLKKGG